MNNIVAQAEKENPLSLTNTNMIDSNAVSAGRSTPGWPRKRSIKSQYAHRYAKLSPVLRQKSCGWQACQS